MHFFSIFHELDSYSGKIPFFLYISYKDKIDVNNFSLNEKRFESFRKRLISDGSLILPENYQQISNNHNNLSINLVLRKNKKRQTDDLEKKFNDLCEIARLTIISQLDGATGLYNKKTFLESFVYFLRELKNNTPGEDYVNIYSGNRNNSISLIMFDIDHFKKFNDNFGHLTGDRVITEVAHILREVSEKEDGFAARYGGEEYALILKNREEKESYEVAENLRKKVMSLKLRDLSGEDIPGISISLGIRSFHINGIEENLEFLRDELISQADLALYAAKNRGRNFSYIFSDLRKFEGRIVEIINKEQCIINLGIEHQVVPGNKFTVIHGKFDGEKEIIEEETGINLGKSPKILKGTISVINHYEKDNREMSRKISLCNIDELNSDMKLSKGDKLEIDNSLPEFPYNDVYINSIKIDKNNFYSWEKLTEETNSGSHIIIFKINSFNESLRNKGKIEFKNHLKEINNFFASENIRLIPLSSDKYMFYTDSAKDNIKIFLKNKNLCGFLLTRDFLKSSEDLIILKSMLGIWEGKEILLELTETEYFSYAAALFHMNRFNEGLFFLKKYKNKLSKYCEYCNLAGSFYFRTGNFNKSLEFFKKAVKIDKKNFMNWMNLGIIELNLGNIKGSIKSFEETLKINPDSPKANNNYAYALLISGKEAKKALKHAKLAVKHTRDEKTAILYQDTVAQALIQLDRAEEAVKILVELIKKREDIIEISVHMIEALVKLNRIKEISKYVDILKSNAPGHPILKEI